MQKRVCFPRCFNTFIFFAHSRWTNLSFSIDKIFIKKIVSHMRGWKYLFSRLVYTLLTAINQRIQLLDSIPLSPFPPLHLPPFPPSKTLRRVPLYQIMLPLSTQTKHFKSHWKTRYLYLGTTLKYGLLTFYLLSFRFRSRTYL